jgi:electron transfer flavoprotein beta subunit
VIGTTKALNQPRYPTLPDIMKARKKEIATLELEFLALEMPSGGMDLLELKPAVETRRGKVLEGTPEEAVAELIRLLREEAKVI